MCFLSNTLKVRLNRDYHDFSLTSLGPQASQCRCANRSKSSASVGIQLQIHQVCACAMCCTLPQVPEFWNNLTVFFFTFTKTRLSNSYRCIYSWTSAVVLFYWLDSSFIYFFFVEKNCIICIHLCVGYNKHSRSLTCSINKVVQVRSPVEPIWISEWEMIHDSWLID